MISKKLFESKLNVFLKQSADFNYIISKRLCKTGYVDKEDCSWYHGVWQYLRLCDRASAPTWHFEFYTNALSNFLKEGDSILISSAADYSMLAVVIEVVKHLKINVSITVADICETPLIINEWYSEQIDFPIKLLRVDLRKMNIKNKYNIIITDAFLTRFNNNEKGVIIERWSNSLKSGGYVITTIRLEPNLKGELITPEKVYVKDYIGYLNNCLTNIFCSTGNKCRKIEKILNLATTYSKKMISYPFSDEKDIIKLFEKYNFKIVESQVARVKGEFRSTSYCRIIAQSKKVEED